MTMKPTQGRNHILPYAFLYTGLFKLFILLFWHFSGTVLQAQICTGDRYLKRVFNDIQFTNGIQYGDLKKNAFGRDFRLDTDMYEPLNDTLSERAVIIMIHGGGHIDIPILTRKSPDVGALAADLARRGYVVFSPTYRLIDLRALNGPLDSIYTNQLFHSILDLNDLFCYLRDSYENGNPLKIDLNKVFMGGVSSGAIITTHSILMTDTTELRDKEKLYARQVSAFDNFEFQDFLQDKFCGINVLGALCFSTTLIDTTLIKPTTTAWYFNHSTEDPLTPYNEGFFTGTQSFGITYGPGVYAAKLKAQGTTVKTDIFDNDKHPSFMKISLDLPGFLSLVPDIRIPESFTEEGFKNLIFNREVLDSSLNSVSRFCYELMGCRESFPTSVRAQKVHLLKVYPNPVTNGVLSVELPIDFSSGRYRVSIFDVSGKRLDHVVYHAVDSKVAIEMARMSAGFYFLELTDITSGEVGSAAFQVQF
jgi:acetyl esterase/lipase